MHHLSHLDNTWDRMSIYAYDYKTQGSVTLFEHPDCSGNFATFPSEVGGGTRSYDVHHMEQGGLRNDTASAVAIPVGYQIELCEHPSF